MPSGSWNGKCLSVLHLGQGSDWINVLISDVIARFQQKLGNVGNFARSCVPLGRSTDSGIPENVHGKGRPLATNLRLDFIEIGTDDGVAGLM
jgi:hypothetical protein